MTDTDTKLIIEPLLSSTKREPIYLAKLRSLYRKSLVGDLRHLLDRKLLSLVNVFADLLYLRVYDEISSLRYTRHLRRDICMNIKVCIVLNYDIFDRAYVRALKGGLRHDHAVISITSGVVEVVNYFSLGQSALHFLSYM